MLTAALSMAYSDDQIRSVWVLPWNISSPSQIDEVIRQAVLSGQTELLVEVRYRSDALYTPNRIPNPFYNPEPRSPILGYDSFDPLEYIIQKARLADLQIHAWVVVFNATPLDSVRLATNYIYQNHREWITYNANGTRMNTGVQYGYFIDPGIPEVQDYLLDVFSDLVYSYPELDGLHLDYIRYPSPEYGYHPISLKRYEDYRQVNPRTTWNEWRILQIDSFVERLHNRIKDINEKIILSAAVFAFYEDAEYSYAQKWENWLKKGIIDRVYPMLYNRDEESFIRNLNTIDKMKQGKKIVMGLRAWNNDGSSLIPKPDAYPNGTYTIYDVADKVDLLSSKKLAGIALFSYEGLRKDNALYELSKLIYPDTPHRIPDLLAYHEQEAPSPPITPVIRSNFELSIEQDMYQIRIDVPNDGRWKWELKNKDQKIVYQRYRYYLEGDNTDYWNGILDDGTRVSTGEYFVHLFKDSDQFEYIIPLQIPELKG